MNQGLDAENVVQSGRQCSAEGKVHTTLNRIPSTGEYFRIVSGDMEAEPSKKILGEIERIREDSRLRLQQIPTGQHNCERPPFVAQELSNTLRQAERWLSYLQSAQAGQQREETPPRMAGVDPDGDGFLQAHRFVSQAQRTLVMCDGIVEAWKSGAHKPRGRRGFYVYSFFVLLGLVLGSWITRLFAPIST